MKLFETTVNFFNCFMCAEMQSSRKISTFTEMHVMNLRGCVLKRHSMDSNANFFYKLWHIQSFHVHQCWMLT